jgi:hypothetical protein
MDMSDEELNSAESNDDATEKSSDGKWRKLHWWLFFYFVEHEQGQDDLPLLDRQATHDGEHCLEHSNRNRRTRNRNSRKLIVIFRDIFSSSL